MNKIESELIKKMQLAYGKFDPDLNPIPFSDWSKFFNAVEIDLVQYFQWKLKVKSYFMEWVNKKELMVIPRLTIRTQRDSSEYQDLFEIWEESFRDQTLYYSIYSGRKKWDSDLSLLELKKLPQKYSYFYEWAKDDRVLNTIFLKEFQQFGGFVVDPHWHLKHFPKVDVAIRFKLHGWHDQRWIRRYGIPLSSKIIRTVSDIQAKGQATSLVLSYSGKTEEAQYFKSK